MNAAFATELTVDHGRVKVLPVHFGDLDPMGMVHNARHALPVERALAMYWEQRGCLASLFPHRPAGDTWR